MGAEKKPIYRKVSFLVVVTLLLFIGFNVFLHMENLKNPPVPWQMVSDLQMERHGMMIEIRGECKNIGRQDFTYVQIQFPLYNEAGRRVDTAFASLEEGHKIKAGDTWSFTASAYDSQNVVTSFGAMEIAYW